jgi:hypothetical protein
MTLPQKTIERIKLNAHQHADRLSGPTYAFEQLNGYIAGATTEAGQALEREKILVEALKRIAKQHTTDEMEVEGDIEIGYDSIISVARATLASYRGEKEVGNGEFDYETRETIEKPQPAPEGALNRMHERWAATGERRQCEDCGTWFISNERCPECNPLG